MTYLLVRVQTKERTGRTGNVGLILLLVKDSILSWINQQFCAVHIQIYQRNTLGLEDAKSCGLNQCTGHIYQRDISKGLQLDLFKGKCKSSTDKTLHYKITQHDWYNQPQIPLAWQNMLVLMHQHTHTQKFWWLRHYLISNIVEDLKKKEF